MRMGGPWGGLGEGEAEWPSQALPPSDLVPPGAHGQTGKILTSRPCKRERFFHARPDWQIVIGRARPRWNNPRSRLGGLGKI